MTNAKNLTKIHPSVVFTTVSGSSLVAGYAREAGDLAVRFNDGKTYIYKGVDDATVKAFAAASSKGKYFGTHIKNKFIAEQAE
jgi:hypothetical protein